MHQLALRCMIRNLHLAGAVRRKFLWIVETYYQTLESLMGYRYFDNNDEDDVRECINHFNITVVLFYVLRLLGTEAVVTQLISDSAGDVRIWAIMHMIHSHLCEMYDVPFHDVVEAICHKYNDYDYTDNVMLNTIKMHNTQIVNAMRNIEGVFDSATLAMFGVY